VFVESAGSGDLALLAITPIGAAWLHEALPADLAERFTIHVAELPGTGRSGGAPGEQTVASVAVAVSELATTLGRPVLFGHSMNGALALAAAATFDCAGVIAVAPPASFPPDPEINRAFWTANAEPERRRLADELIAAYEASDDDAEKRELQGRHNRLRQWFDMEFDPAPLDALDDLRLDWISALFANGATVDWPATRQSVACPVLLALGEHDFISPPTAWTDDTRPPRATTELFARSAHNPFVEQPHEFVAAVDRWLKANF